MRKPTIDPNRGTGRTTRQMLAAPQGAVFVSAHAGSVSYDKALALKHGRSDLKIVAPDWFSGGRWTGLRLTGIVIDHATQMTEQRQEYLQMALTRVRK